MVRGARLKVSTEEWMILTNVETSSGENTRDSRQDSRLVLNKTVEEMSTHVSEVHTSLCNVYELTSCKAQWKGEGCCIGCWSRPLQRTAVLDAPRSYEAVSYSVGASCLVISALLKDADRTVG